MSQKNQNQTKYLDVEDISKTGLKQHMNVLASSMQLQSIFLLSLYPPLSGIAKCKTPPMFGGIILVGRNGKPPNLVMVSTLISIHRTKNEEKKYH